MRWLALALLLTLVEAASKSPLGVPPHLASKYVAVKDTWKCLDGSKDILWKAVNDDYCDCPDGSDEPGWHYRIPPDTYAEFCGVKGRVRARIIHFIAKMRGTLALVSQAQE